MGVFSKLELDFVQLDFISDDKYNMFSKWINLLFMKLTPPGYLPPAMWEHSVKIPQLYTNQFWLYCWRLTIYSVYNNKSFSAIMSIDIKVWSTLRFGRSIILPFVNGSRVDKIWDWSNILSDLKKKFVRKWYTNKQHQAKRKKVRK